MSDSRAERSAGTTIGVTGQMWRASVSPWGSVTPWSPSPASGDDDPQTLDWYIAADDRWHVPATEAAVRQQRLGGAPVTETRVRIPDGDAVQRVWSVADRGGLTIIEVENDSPLPFAVAFCGIDVLTARRPTFVPVQGIDLPPEAITLPVAHHTSIRVAIPHRRIPDGVDPHAVSLSGAPDADAVVRGWVSVADRASRVDLPDEALLAALVSARCDLLLEGPVDADEDPLGFVLDVGELVRCGEAAEPWLMEVVAPLESMARSSDPLLPAAAVAARRVALAAGDERAAGDLARLVQRTAGRVEVAPRGSLAEVRRGRSAGRFINEIERRLVDGTELLPGGIPTSWLGSNFEVHGIPTSASSSVSLAVRWHGERPAVLWEQEGDARCLTASTVDPDWSTADMSGEALWPAARRSTRASMLTVSAEPAAVTPPATPPPTVAPDTSVAKNPGIEPDTTVPPDTTVAPDTTVPPDTTGDSTSFS